MLTSASSTADGLRAWLTTPRAYFLMAFVALLAAAGWHHASRPVLGQNSQGDDADEIVFLDLGGFIRVYDYVDNGTAIRWFSPVGDFADIALGDVNADGDMEIIGVRGGFDDGELIVYDPVVQASDVDQIPIAGYINGVPWATLYTRSVPGEPTLVGAGELVLATLGDELVFGSRINDEIARDDDAIYQLTTLQATGRDPDGRSWRTLVDQAEFDEEWTWLDVGDADGRGADEIAVVAYEEGWLHLYRDLLSEPVFSRENKSRPWRAAVIGPFMGRDRPGLVAIRNAGPGIDNFWAFEYVDGRWVDAYFENFFPPPEFLFLADVEGSGGEEAFMLRSVPTNINNRARFFSRDELGRTILEDVLANSDNRYQAGAGGNIDGDFGDEVVIIRNDRLRIYTDPTAGSGTFEEVLISTNSRTIVIGNLDEGIFQAPPLLTVNNNDTANVSVTLPQGLLQEQAGLDAQIEVSNGTGDRTIPFTYSVDETPGVPASWIIVEPTRLETPAVLNIRFDTRLLEPGTYSTTIRLRSSEADPRNQPVRIFVTLIVEPGIAVLPNPGVFVFAPCTPPLAPQEKIFTVRGVFGLDYAVGLDSGGAPVDWATVTPTGGTIPGSFTIRVDPATLPQNNPRRATLTLVPLQDADLYEPRTVPLVALCAQVQWSLPLIRR